MEKKEIKRRNDSLRTIFNYWSRFKPFFWRKNPSFGFTLVELLIVILVIGIMAAGLLYIIDPLGQIQKANDAKRKSDLEQLQRTLETYYNDNGKYPPSSGSTIIAPCTGTYRINPPTGCTEWGTSWTVYNTTLLKDPTSSTRNYVYFASSDGQSYWIYTSLEKSGDPQLCSPLDANGECPSITTNTIAIKSCGPFFSKPCNYGASSPNTNP